MSGAAGHGGWQHWLGFLASGAATFITDNGVLEVLVRGLGVPVLPSRIVSIWCAMAVGFFAHRTLTFAVATRPNWGEFVRYIGVAWTASAVNFGHEWAA